MKKIIIILFALVTSIMANAQSISYSGNLVKLAESGDAAAMTNLGDCYYNGKGVNKDFNKAADWYKKAAKAGNATAMVSLGDCYYNGIGVTQDVYKAASWLRKAAKEGNSDAMSYLGTCYLSGAGVPQNEYLAADWFKKAIGKGSIKAIKLYSNCLYCGLGIEKNTQKALLLETAFNKAMKGDMDGAKDNLYDVFPEFAHPLLELLPGSLSFTDASGNNAIDPEEYCKIRFKVYNKGKGEGKGCIAKVKTDADGILVENKTLPNIKARDTLEIEIPVKASRNTQDGQANFSVSVYEPKGYGLEPINLTVDTYAYLDGNKFLDVFKFQKEAETGDYRALYYLSLCYYDGKGVDVDKEKAEILKYASVEAKSGNKTRAIELFYQAFPYLAKNNDPAKAGETLNGGTPVNNVPVMASSDVDVNIPQTGKSDENTFAVIIANENYIQEDKVQFALNDGNTFSTYCKQVLGLPDENVRVINDATLNQIRGGVNWLKRVADAYKGDASIIFYYAGHGVPDEKSKEAYLLPTDGYGNDLITAYKIEDLYTKLSSCPSKRTLVFLDACFSGAQRSGNMMASARAVGISVKKTTPKGNMVVFSAAQGDETAYPYEDKKHGMFTYFLLKKLQQSKGDVTLGDLGSYISNSVLRKSVVTNTKSQTPSVQPSPTMTNTWKNIRL